MKLGPCIDLSACSASIVDTGGALGTWNAAAGTFTVALEASSKAGCGGSNDGRQWSELTLTLNASCTVSVAVAGTGGVGHFEDERAEVWVDDILTSLWVAEGGGGGGGGCDGSPLVLVSNEAVPACACTEVRLRFDNVGPDRWNGAWECTFTLTLT